MMMTSSTLFFLFLIFFVTIQPTPQSHDTIIVQVKYARSPVRRTEGQPLTLKCTAEYEEEHCGSISVIWCISESENPCQPLTDPNRYLIHVNESESSRETMSRQRDAFVKFMQLTLNDTGLYQCKAICESTGATAMGHLINVTVTGQKILNQTDRCSVDMFLLIISLFILLWIHKM